MKKNTTIKGKKSVLKTIIKVKAKTKKITSEIIERAALEIEGDAASTVQVDQGRLKGSIQTIEQDPSNFEVSAGGMVVDGKEVDYAAHIEFGTKNSRAYPFMRPAAAKIEKKYLDIVAKGIQQGIKQAGVK